MREKKALTIGLCATVFELFIMIRLTMHLPSTSFTNEYLKTVIPLGQRIEGLKHSLQYMGAFHRRPRREIIPGG